MLNGPILKPFSKSKPQSAAILLHGLGDSGAGLIGLGEAWHQALPNTIFFAPNAPYPCDGWPMGYQWFSGMDWTPSVVLEGVKKAAPCLNEYIDNVMTTQALPASRVALVGFSQGTIMSLYVAPRRAEQLAGVLGYSGVLMGGEELATEKKSSPPIFLAHGVMDDVLPFAAMAQAEAALKRNGFDVSTLTRPHMGHNIDDVALAEGERFLKRILAP